MNYGRLKERNSAFVRDDLIHHNEVWRGLPEIVNFNHTDICNLRCIMCYESVTPGRTRISVPRIREILAQVLPTARKLKLTTAGEPMILDFDEIVELAREYQVLLSMITNGTHLTVERYMKMKDVLHHITLSLDSHDRDIFTKIRGKGAYDKIMANLGELGKIASFDRHVFHIQMVLMRSNLETFPEFVAFAKQIGAHVVSVARLHFPFEGLKETEDIFGDFPAETRDKYIRAAIEEAKRLGVNLMVADLGYENVLHHAAPPILPVRPDTYICGWVAQEIYIDPLERVLPCCIADDSLIMGDLKKHSFLEVWNGAKYQKLRRAMFEQTLKGYCANCKLYAPLPNDDSYNLAGLTKHGKAGLIDRMKSLLKRPTAAH
ncbi:MAG: radical SAM protein [Planctomycetes bacterium]|nr:radical SAM protein [Planctomycetota bacterium]MBI3845832.1 radical SAM protein [Planctomycetota bacterium]